MSTSLLLSNIVFTISILAVKQRTNIVTATLCTCHFFELYFIEPSGAMTMHHCVSLCMNTICLSIFVHLDASKWDVTAITGEHVPSGLNTSAAWEIFCFAFYSLVLSLPPTHTNIPEYNCTVGSSLWSKPESLCKHWTPRFIYSNWIYFRLWQTEFHWTGLRY